MGVIAWLKAQRQWHRDHQAAFALVAQRLDDDLTQFQHLALTAIADVVPPASFRRVNLEDEVGDTLVAPLGSEGEEVWVYPNEAAIIHKTRGIVLEEWAFRTPQDLIAVLASECQRRAA
jgi:hypothetical protein